jgi:hypothetical protein
MIKFSKKYKAVQARIKRLPQLIEDTAKVLRKGDAYDLVMYWRNGIKNKSLRLASLKNTTIRRKKYLGYTKPSTPLYGAGDEAKDTYIKGMRVFPLKKGWAVKMMHRRHGDDKVYLDQLFNVHEYGAIINNGKAIIRIPSRPAMHRAYERVLKGIKRRDQNDTIMRVCEEYLLTTRKDLYKRIKEKAEKWEGEVGKAT